MLLCLLASPDALMAQGKTVPNTVRDTIYHRNGWVYHGQITKYTEGEMVRLRDPSGAPHKFPLDDVLKIDWSLKSRIKFLDEEISWDSIPVVDIVFLKDGSIFRGTVLEYHPDGSIRLQTKAGVLDVNHTDIRKLVQEPLDPQFFAALRHQKKEKVYAFREHGFYFTTLFGLLPGGGEYRSEVGMTLQASFGHKFSRYLGLGGGISLDGYPNSAGGENILPLFLEARGYLQKKNRSPYWSLAGGYGFPLRASSDNQEVRRFEGGLMLHPAVGYRLGADKGLNVVIDIGYKFQKALTEREFLSTGEILLRDVLYRRLCIRIGVAF
ncbi:MAG: hypothetical protein R2824_18295 [Saprospiraceae bacterium]